MWVRGLKHRFCSGCKVGKRAHPMWVRGLKPDGNKFSEDVTGVAPYVGAWIETLLGTHMYVYAPSHPMWVRGLKPAPGKYDNWRSVAPYVGAWIETVGNLRARKSKGSRTLCGCVD